MEGHAQCLAKLCRVCGKTNSKDRVTYKCEDKTNLLLNVNIDVKKDDHNIHPPRFCHTCYCALMRAEKSGTQISLRVTFWNEHGDTHCKTCSRLERNSRPGRKSKIRKGVRHVNVTCGQLLQAVHSLELPQLATAAPLTPSRFLTPPSPIQLEDFVCHSCNCVLDEPVETKCRHTVCKVCLCKHLLKYTTQSCPICHEQFNAPTDIRSLPEALTRLLGALKVHCDHANVA